jgi:hypothetical protein
MARTRLLLRRSFAAGNRPSPHRALRLARRLKDHVKESPLGIVTGDDDLYRLTDFEQVSVIPTELDCDVPGSGALGSNSCRGHCPRLGASFAPDNGSQGRIGELDQDEVGHTSAGVTRPRVPDTERSGEADGTHTQPAPLVVAVHARDRVVLLICPVGRIKRGVKTGGKFCSKSRPQTTFPQVRGHILLGVSDGT